MTRNTFLHRAIRSFLPLLFLAVATCLSAQENDEAEKAACLFPDLTDGYALLKNRLTVRTKFNYDCVKQVLYFLDREQKMEMDDTSNIDTLYIQQRKFVPYQSRFLECIPFGGGCLLVDWKARAHNIGKKGAMGIVTQAGGIDKMDVNYLQGNGTRDRTGNEVYAVKYENSYLFPIGGKQRRFSNLKSFLKYFPKERQKEIEYFAKSEKIAWEEPRQVARLLDFALKE